MSGLDGLDQPNDGFDQPNDGRDRPDDRVDQPDDGLDQPNDGRDRPDERVVMVAAVARNGVIGRDGDIPWSIPEDLKHFRAVTRGHTVLMGRSTYESIGHPLPYRTNIVITRREDWSADGVLVAHSVEEGLDLARGLDGDVMVIGGGEIYREAMPHATHQVLTEVDLEPEGDTHYPEWDRSGWVEERREQYDGYAFVWWRRAD